RVDYQHVDRARLHQGLGDLQRLLAVVRLRDEQILDLDAELARVGRVERVFGVDKRAGTARLLRFRDTFQRERGLARRFRAVDFYYAPARQSTHAEREVESERAGRYDGDIARNRLLAELHDRALAELFFDLAQREVERFTFDLYRHRLCPCGICLSRCESCHKLAPIALSAPALVSTGGLSRRHCGLLTRLEQKCRERFVAGSAGAQMAAVERERFDSRDAELAVPRRVQCLAGFARDRPIANPADRPMPAPAPLLALES